MNELVRLANQRAAERLLKRTQSEQTNASKRRRQREERKNGATEQCSIADATSALAGGRVWCPTCADGGPRGNTDDDAMTLLVNAESWLYHSATQDERWTVAAKIRAFVCARRGDNPWRDSQRITPQTAGHRDTNQENE